MSTRSTPKHGHVSTLPLNFGASLTKKRTAAKLSQLQLARASGLSPRTIKRLETGHSQPTPGTLAALQKVRVLGINAPSLPNHAAEFAPQCWLSPNYDVLSMSRDMVEVLNSSGGVFEQTHLYLDGAAADDYLKMSASHRYKQSFRDRLPLRRIAELVAQSSTGHGLDVHALGVGDGQTETNLIHLLVDNMDMSDLRLYMLDISPVMVNESYRHAADRLDGLGVVVFALAGDFYDLRSIPVMSYRSAASSVRQRLYTMIGGTASNLADEAGWFRELAACAAPGDLLLLDVRVARAAAGDVAAIYSAEPSLQTGPPSSHEAWLSGPILRHCRGAQDVTFRIELVAHNKVPGSYELDWIAVVRMADGTKREFLMLRGKSYDPKQLAEFLRPLGWGLKEVALYCPESPQALLLMQRL